MKKTILRTLIFVVVVLMAACKVTAQRYTTHQVKEGETLQSIAKQYRVTPYTILQLNKELKTADDVKPNTLLVIPLDGTPRPNDPKIEKEEKPPQIEPLGFKRHRVRRKETIFSITQRYEISEEQLKKYNTDLYASPLKKGMVLQIPEFPELEEDESALDFEMYTVQPKETRWSIAHKYGITIDSLVALNPDLPKNTSYLAEGQELKLPRPKGDSLEEQTVALFESYTVPKSIGLFRISQNYGISTDSIIKLNPEIIEQNGLKEGMVLRLPKQKPKSEIVNTDNYIFYEVKPKQTLFSLTRNLQISRDSLFDLNPELENGLKAGMVLKLPKMKAKSLEVKNALVLDKINLIDSIDVTLRPKLLYLLPFRLDRIDFRDAEKTEAQIKSRNDIKYALGLYSGTLIALDSIKKLGVSVDVKFLDTQRSLQAVKVALQKEILYDVDAVVGPIDPSLLGEVAVQASSHQVPVVAPYAAQNELSLGNVFFSVPNDDVMRQHILDHVAKRHKSEHIIIIADEKNQAAKDSILVAFPMARVAKMSEDGSLHLVDFQAMLSETEENWVFVETQQSNLAASVSSILNASNKETEEGNKVVVKMFTTNYNNAFENEVVSSSHLSNLNFTFPSFYKEVGNDAFVKAYRKKFGFSPDKYAIRGFDLTFDLLLKLAHKKNLFETSNIIGLTEYSGNRFNYFNDWSSGFFNEGTYLLKYEELRIKEVEADDL
ncbi:LysM peptidoglycan-binding domain-containing protein [Allomuricauda sp. SCSIO 65647]|uniref:PBP1 and LysM peptidoglycan-binding domain-containing protein n=1 Tax=Allomuricauda sp. SCSIO 65647 TaxID=2908843 RepID=UPI001F27DFEA|nr:LysM peptidoglycan-binding domain-containing protein [Muricauda sp. SCSIO 65647]UJH67938.1 LysM peptidoglycan-binding domain-containing protein [Muricauda sp. SCSIO 65647]